jgi:WS/DGAT/MGAT family acyltransferase
MDTPSNLATITGVLSFDRRLDFERLKATLVYRLLVHRRFRQRIHEPVMGLGLPRWQLDDQFDFNYHLIPTRLPEPADQGVLQNRVSELMCQPLDRSRPLWQFHYVENYETGSALICRLHHCIADGLALVQVLLDTTDDDPQAPWPQPPLEPRSEKGWAMRWLRPAIETAAIAEQSMRAANDLVHEGLETLFSPAQTMQAARKGMDGLMALSKLLLIGPDRKTILRGKCDIPKKAAWSSPVGLQDVKAVGGMMGGTVNDIVLSALTGALRRYLEEHGEMTEGVDIRVVVPVNLRPILTANAAKDDSLMGNRFGLVFLSLPVGIRDPLKRLVTLRRRMNAIKDSPEALVAFGLLGAFGMTPVQVENILVAIFGLKATGVMTNVPGPRQPLYLAGGRIDGLMFWVPTPANLALGVSIVSYANQVVLGLATDEGLIPDPQVVLDAFVSELEDMKRWGRPIRPGARQITASTPKPMIPHAKNIPPQTIVGAHCSARTKSGQLCKNRPIVGSTTCRIHQAVK